MTSDTERNAPMLNIESAVLVFVDVQGKLADIMHEKERLYDNLERMVRGADILGLPVLWTEQLPEKIGPTIERFAALLEGRKPVVKGVFGCGDSVAFMDALRGTRATQVILAGIEAHICVTQTALQLLRAGLEVFVVADAVLSRTAANRDAALLRMRDAGAVPVSTEMALFELLRDAEDKRFRAVLNLVK